MTDSTDSKGNKPANKVVRLPKKLTRTEIREGFNQFPVEVLLSAGKNKQAQLTTKQREFARNLALGKTQAQAYRDSRDSKGTAVTQGNNASRLAADSRIQAEVEAYKLAIEAEKHRTPAQLKSLLVQQLVQHSLDEEFPPAQRVQCLKLLGSLFEVGAFVERKEVTTVSRSGDIRARIMETLKDVTDVTTMDDGLSLLEEIKQANDAPDLAGTLTQDSADPAGAPVLDGQTGDPTPGAPAASGTAARGSATHSVPDSESSAKSIEEFLMGEDPPIDFE
jgi:hypothetical protein